MPLRLYVNDKYIADAIVANCGRWLVDASKVLTQHSQLVRIDVLRAGSSDVEARAEVNFVIDVPQPATPAAPTAPTAVASNPAGRRLRLRRPLRLPPPGQAECWVFDDR